MRIVMHCLYFPPEIGGLESHVFHLCKGLVEAGCDVSFVTSSSQVGLLAEEQIEGIKVSGRGCPSGQLLDGLLMQLDRCRN